MEQDNKKNSRPFLRLPLHVYLGYLLIASFLFTGVSFSKYVATSSAASAARVAAFSVTAEGAGADELVVEALDGAYTYDSYSFRVTSNSEVAVADVVTVILPEALPEGITMTVTVNSETITPHWSGSTCTFAKDFSMGSDTHNWTLTFGADANTLALGEEYVLEGIIVHVDAIQQD